ncbi:MAG: CDP-glycerol glycerophosphotransferase family protein [Coprobacillus sp.]
MTTKIKELIIRIIWSIFSFFPIQKRKIVISCFEGKSLQDNPKYIAEELLKNNENDYKIICLCNLKTDDLDKRIKVKSNFFIFRIFHLCTAKIWIDNCRKAYYTKKKDNQFYIQTWHGGMGLKQIEYDVLENLSYDYVKWMDADTKNMDLLISDSEFISAYFKRVFRFDGEIMQCGLPRCDIFQDIAFKANTRRDLLKKLNINEDKKIILYAPTFRNDRSTDKFSLDFESLLLDLNKAGEDYVILLRLHPNLSMLKRNIYDNKSIIDVTSFSNMQELLILADYLITDYSSCMFDFIHLNKPCFLYVPDMDDYLKERKFLMDINELPFPKVKQYTDLLCFLKGDTQYDFIKAYQLAYKKYGIVECGNASRVLHTWIDEKIKNT